MLKRLLTIFSFLMITLSLKDIKTANQHLSSEAQSILQGAKYPQEFRWGTAVAEWQNSGSNNCGNSNWSEFEQMVHKNGQPTIKGDQKSGKACDSWNNMERDIAYMEQIGLNSYRFSISWEAIEPNPGEYNQAAIDHYRTLIRLLLEAGIEPMITLHHFVHPAWFQKLGAFEKQENIVLFTQFSEKMFNEFSDTVKLWCVINEANVSGFQGYIYGAFPPAKVMNFSLAATVLRNLMQAHTETYLKLKSLPNGDTCQIGFVHQYLKFEPYRWINPLESIISKILSLCFVNTPVFNFLKTGTFSPSVLSSKWDYTAPTSGPIADFIGLNFYSRVLVNWGTPSCYENEIMTDMPYALCPDKFYDAIKDVSTLGLPIYITENGIADKLDNKRPIYFKKYLGALSRAIKDGYNIRGFYYWTLIDNFEWDEGYNMRFGLVDYNTKTGESRLRDSVKLYTDVIIASKL